MVFYVQETWHFTYTRHYFLSHSKGALRFTLSLITSRLSEKLNPSAENIYVPYSNRGIFFLTRRTTCITFKNKKEYIAQRPFKSNKFNHFKLSVKICFYNLFQSYLRNDQIMRNKILMNLPRFLVGFYTHIRNYHRNWKMVEKKQQVPAYSRTQAETEKKQAGQRHRSKVIMLLLVFCMTASFHWD